MHKKLLVLALTALTAVAGFASATSFSFPAFSTSDPIGNKFADAHFFTPGNDFAGSFFRLPTKQVIPGVSVSLGASSRACTKQVRGLYFGNAWGDRLWPLDAETLSGLATLDPSYGSLIMTGALYTSCTNPTNTGKLELYSIYGQIKYTRAGMTYSVSMGRRYDVPTNTTLPGAPLVSSLQYFNNESPLGYFYDNIAGVGFIGGVMDISGHDAAIDEINSGGYIDDIFKYDTGSTSDIIAHTTIGDYALSGGAKGGLDTLRRIAVLGNVLLSKGGLGADDRRSILGNPNQGSSIVVSDKMNISNSINLLKRNASNLCRGKKVYDETTWSTAPDTTVCVGQSSNDFLETSPMTIDLNNVSQYSDKTIIVYGKNVILHGTMPAGSNYSLNLFIDRGNALIDEVPPTVAFDKDGNVGTGVAALYIRGNLFINGLLMGIGGAPLTHKLYVHGRFASLNTGLEPAASRTTQIQSLLNNTYTTYGTLVSSTFCAGFNCINFNNVFAWECQLDGHGTDGNICNIVGDRFKYNPLIIIDITIPTLLL